MYELDHIFVCVDSNAPEAELLVAFGLAEGEPNAHPGQGTANRRFFFHNAFLELLWVSDPLEAQSELVRPTQIWSRWTERNSGTSPFGVCLRPSHASVQDIPFPFWEYRPPYLPSHLSIHVGEQAPPSEPFWFYLGFGRRPDASEWRSRQPLAHPIGFREITQVRLERPAPDRYSATAAAVLKTGAVTMQPGAQHLLEITYDGGSKGRTKDFKPALPLVFCW